MALSDVEIEGLLLDAVRRHADYWEEWLALYFAALEQTRDVEQAVQMADANVNDPSWGLALGELYER